MTSLEGPRRQTGKYKLDITAHDSIITPLRVSHALVMEVWFSLQGQDEWGKPCEEYKTRVRTLTLRKAVMIPSVSGSSVSKLTIVCIDSRIRRSSIL
jgi:hypothetical protein